MGEWVAEGSRRTNLGTHWLDRDNGEIIIWDGNRGLLDADMEGQEESVVKITIQAPEEPGRYILQYDMVHEGVTWFSEQGVIPLEVNIDVGKTLDMSVVRITSIQVFNGNGIAGAAGEAEAALEIFGFKIHSLANADSFDFEETAIIYNEGQEEAAQQLKIIFEDAPVYEYDSDWANYKSKADLMLILGKDYKGYLE